MKEIEIKRKLIKWLIQKSDSGFLLGSEFRFHFGARRADIITLTGEVEACAYEIKGTGDSLRTLYNQCQGYKLYFDTCYIVCEKENLSSVRKNCPKDVGLLLISGNDFIQIRKSRVFKKLNSISLSSTIEQTVLEKETNRRKISKHELCEIFSTTNKASYVKSISRKSLKDKITQQFLTFMNEIGQELNYDDLATLDRMSALHLF